MAGLALYFPKRELSIANPDEYGKLVQVGESHNSLQWHVRGDADHLQVKCLVSRFSGNQYDVPPGAYKSGCKRWDSTGGAFNRGKITPNTPRHTSCLRTRSFPKKECKRRGFHLCDNFSVDFHGILPRGEDSVEINTLGTWRRARSQMVRGGGRSGSPAITVGLSRTRRQHGR